MNAEAGSGIWGVVGYAVGTAQILILDWVNARKTHQSHLRLIRAELRRLRAINGKFGWKDTGPGADVLPSLPN